MEKRTNMINFQTVYSIGIVLVSVDRKNLVGLSKEGEDLLKEEVSGYWLIWFHSPNELQHGTQHFEILNSSYCRTEQLIIEPITLCNELCLALNVFNNDTMALAPARKPYRIVFIDSFVVSALQDAGGYAISRQNNLELHLGCHTCWLSYFTLVCLWCWRTVSRCTVTWLPNFLGWVDYFIFLPLVLRWRASRTRAPLLCFIIGVLAVGVETSRCDKCIIVTKEITFGEEPVNGDCNRLNRNRKIGITQRGVHQLICRYSVNVFSTISTDFVYCIQLTGT